jgi:hypothetical protein
LNGAWRRETPLAELPSPRRRPKRVPTGRREDEDVRKVGRGAQSVKGMKKEKVNNFFVALLSLRMSFKAHPTFLSFFFSVRIKHLF